MNYEELNDYEILYLIGESDDYRETIFKKYKPMLSEICSKYMQSLKKCGMEFDDLYQEALIALNRAIDSYDYNSSLFYSYVNICVNRHLSTFYRTSTTKRSSTLNYAISMDYAINDLDDVTIYDVISDNSNVYGDVDISLDVIDFKNQLSDREAQVFELRWNGFTYKEISKLIDIKIKNVDYYMQKIRRKIHCYF